MSTTPTKAKRLYHAAITMPKVARRNLILKSDPALPLFEYDVKSCTPVILLGLTHDPAEKAKLKTLLDGDIYTTIATESGVTKDRDKIKQDFMLFLNGTVQNYVHKFFHTNLPSLTEWLIKNRRQKGAWRGLGRRLKHKSWFRKSRVNSSKLELPLVV